jgi:hypothetical protein
LSYSLSSVRLASSLTMSGPLKNQIPKGTPKKPPAQSNRPIGTAYCL